MPIVDMALNPRQEKFCQLFHESGKQGESYAGAFGCNMISAAPNAWRLLRNDKIQARLDELRGEAREQCALDNAAMLDYAADVLMTPIGDIDEHSPLCEEISHNDHGKKLKMFSKSSAFDKIARMCGYYEPEKVEHDIPDELGDILAGIRKR